MLNEVAKSFRRRTDDGGSRRKRLQHRNWHVVQPGCVNKNISLVVKPRDLLPRSHSGEADAVQMERLYEFANLAFLRSISNQGQPSLWKRFLQLSKSANHHVYAVIAM